MLKRYFLNNKKRNFSIASIWIKGGSDMDSTGQKGINKILSSFYGNELLWDRKSSINNLDSFLKYWNDLDNFKEITKYIDGDKFTLIASPSKC